jgi:hypothetical protein
MGYVTFILLVLLHNMIVEIRHDNCALLFLLNGTTAAEVNLRKLREPSEIDPTIGIMKSLYW